MIATLVLLSERRIEHAVSSRVTGLVAVLSDVANYFKHTQNSGGDDQEDVTDPKPFEHVGCKLPQERVHTLVKDGYSNQNCPHVERPYIQLERAVISHVSKLKGHHI